MDKYIILLYDISKVLEKSNNNAQAHFLHALILLIQNNDSQAFIKGINSASMWGGSGSVWEVDIENKDDERQFEMLIVGLIDMMAKDFICGSGVKSVRKIFVENERGRNTNNNLFL